MLLIPALQHKLVSILFSHDALVCCWIEKTDHGAAPLIVRAYQHYPLDNLELENLIIFNPTIIKKYITSFLEQHHLCDAFITFVLHGPAVMEHFVAMPTSTPHRADFPVAGAAKGMLWEYRYLYPNDHGQFIFYVYAVPRSLILQYQLLAIATQCNLITMTTQTAGLLSAYQHIFGSAFRRTQLAVDMTRCNNNIDALISVDAVNRMLTSGIDIDVAQERSYLAAAVGLFYSERLDK